MLEKQRKVEQQQGDLKKATVAAVRETWQPLVRSASGASQASFDERAKR